MISVRHGMAGHMNSQQLWLPAQDQASWNQKFQHEVPGEGLLRPSLKQRTDDCLRESLGEGALLGFPICQWITPHPSAHGQQ